MKTTEKFLTHTKKNIGFRKDPFVLEQRKPEFIAEGWLKRENIHKTEMINDNERFGIERAKWYRFVPKSLAFL